MTGLVVNRKALGVVIFVGLLGIYIWALESHAWVLLWILAGLACGAFLTSSVALRRTRSKLDWDLMLWLFSGFLIWSGLCYWASMWGFRRGIWWPAAVTGGALVLMFSMSNLVSPQYAVFLVLVGGCVWALLSHSWALLWAMVGGTFLVSLVVSQTMRDPDKVPLFSVLARVSAFGSLIGIIVWGALYHAWWLLLPWFGAALIAGALLQMFEKEREDADKAELTRRQLRELRERQDAALRPDNYAEGKEPAPDHTQATSSSGSYQRGEDRSD